MEKQMLESLKAIKERYDDIQVKLTTPEIVGNIKKFTKLNKDANSFKEVVDAYGKYETYEKSIADAKEIFKTEKDNELIKMAKDEMEHAEQEMPELEEKIKILLVPRDKNDAKDVIVEIRGAAGGDEANIFAGDIYNIYKKWSSQNNMKMKVLSSTNASSGGFTHMTFRIAGDMAYSKLKFETGSHRVQRIPSTETQGRVHTSTATVTVMPEADDDVEIVIKPSDIQIDTYRSSGAGGQSVNTTDSAVRITHLKTGIIVTSQDERSQLQNRETCLSILKTKLYELEVRKQQEHDAAFRALAGSGSRSEKVRTYNYPQDRVTDHRVSLSVSLKSVLDGKINPIIETLQAAEQAARIKEAGL